MRFISNDAHAAMLAVCGGLVVECNGIPVRSGSGCGALIDDEDIGGAQHTCGVYDAYTVMVAAGTVVGIAGHVLLMSVHHL